MIGLRSTSALFGLLPFVFAAPVIHSRDVQTTGTVSSHEATYVDFADAALLRDGDDWWAFASNNHKVTVAVGGSLINIQVAHTSDSGFDDQWPITGIDALPTVGAWANPFAGSQGAAVWAPGVIKNGLGQYVLHYSAAVLGDSKLHCIGTAVATTPEGPYTPEPTPLACPLGQGGAIDSQPFQDADGAFYVVYKIDGNSIGHGGDCGNTVAPIVPTPIMLQRLADDAMTPVGDAVELLDRDALDGPLIEAPSLVRTDDGKYVLFFSSNCFVSSLYDVTYAFADNIFGPYVKYGPMMVSGTDGLYSPGGASVAADGKHMVFHAGDVGPSNLGWRAMYTTTLSIDTVNMVVSSS